MGLSIIVLWIAFARCSVCTCAGETPLEMAGENRRELEKALEAMPGKEVEFLLSRARQYDLANLTAAHLVHTVEYARRARKEMPWGKFMPEDVWMEYVLPYRVADEDLDDWRPEFYETLRPVIAGAKSARDAFLAISTWNYTRPGAVRFKVSENRDMTPRQLLNQIKVGRCFEMNLLMVALLRSVGIPARIGGVPWWLSMDYYHYHTEYWDPEKKDWMGMEGSSVNPDRMMLRGQRFPMTYALPGCTPEVDPIGRERLDLLIPRTPAYLKTGTLEVHVTGRAGTVAIYAWNLGTWRLVAQQATGDRNIAKFDLAPQDKYHPYLVTLYQAGRMAWCGARVSEGRTLLLDLNLLTGTPDMILPYVGVAKKPQPRDNDDDEKGI